MRRHEAEGQESNRNATAPLDQQAHEVGVGAGAIKDLSPGRATVHYVEDQVARTGDSSSRHDARPSRSVPGRTGTHILKTLSRPHFLALRISSRDAVSTVRAARVAGVRHRLRDVGHGRLEWLRRPAVAGGARSPVALGCTFFDTAFVYGEGHSERLLGRDSCAAPGHAPLRRDQGPAEEPRRGPAAPTTPISDVYPYDHIVEHDGAEPPEPRRRADRPAAAPRVERRVGGRRWLEARGAGPQAAGT